MHSIADHVVDSYLDVTRLMECDIDAIEEEAFAPTSTCDIEQIYLLKREVVELRRAVEPLSVELGRINSDHKDLLSKEVLRYMRDVVDHQTHAADRIASYDEMLSSLVQAALAKVGMQQNTDMRKISAWVAIAAVPTMIAGIYGMNFEHMPELSLVWGYPAVTAFGGNPGILSAAGLTGIFNPTQAQLEAEGYTYTQGGGVATFGVTGAPDAANCFFTYTQPTQANVAATISGLTIGGC